MKLITEQEEYKPAEKDIKGYMVAVKKADGTYWTAYLLRPLRAIGEVNDMKDLLNLDGDEMPLPEIVKNKGGGFSVEEEGLFSIHKDLDAALSELGWRREGITPNKSAPDSGYYQLTNKNIIVLECVIPENTQYVEGALTYGYDNKEKNERLPDFFYSARKVICKKELKN